MFSTAITECVSKKIPLLGTLCETYSSNRSTYRELTVNERIIPKNSHSTSVAILLFDNFFITVKVNMNFAPSYLRYTKIKFRMRSVFHIKPKSY
ncbi:hypothetical protein FHG68_07815 [Leptospira weilii]|nr:hypothetical protein FHG67_14445 [Leptospira weilii]QDK26577.1 hypothetical protein FHG68_07815 [Leptospira weilii]